MEIEKWTVLYTKHKTQKTKSFNDGTLEVKSYTPTQIKVFLFDLEGKHLTDRYLASGEKLEPGLRIEFQGYIVDIGERVDDTAACPPVAASVNATEAAIEKWTVLYTKHKTQKTKSFNDGTLEVKSYTPTQIKVFLFDLEGKHLTDRYLASGEKLEPGLRIEFQGYIVDIGEQVDDTAACPPVAASVNATATPTHATPSTLRQRTIPDLFRSRAQASPTALCPGRWVVTYKMGQNKVCRDGVLAPYLENPRKVKLLGENENVLTTGFLGKHDVLAPGSTLELNPYKVSVERAEQDVSTGSCAGTNDNSDDSTSVPAKKVSLFLTPKHVLSSQCEDKGLELAKKPEVRDTKQHFVAKRKKTVNQIMQGFKRPKSSTHTGHQGIDSQSTGQSISSCNAEGRNEDTSGSCTAQKTSHDCMGVATRSQIDEKTDGESDQSTCSVLVKATPSNSELPSSSWLSQPTRIPARPLRVQAMHESQRPSQSPSLDTALVPQDEGVFGKHLPEGSSNPVGALQDGELESEGKGAVKVGVDEPGGLIQGILDFSVEHPVRSHHMEQVLASHSFTLADFWEGYKLYCYGYYSSSESHRRSFFTSTMGRVIRDIHGESSFVWKARFDEKVRSTWSFMEDYLQQRHGLHCTDISALIDKFEDEEALKATADGRLLLAIATDNSKLGSHPSAELALKNSKRISQNNILERIDRELNRADSGLANLQRHTEDLDTRGNQAQQSAECDGSRPSSSTSESKSKHGMCRPEESTSSGPKRKVLEYMDDGSPVWLLEGQPCEVLPFIPSEPSRIATATFCKEADWAECGEALSHFTFTSGRSTWVCETSDPWCVEEEDCVYELAPSISRACMTRCDNMVAVVSSSLTALLKEEQGCRWIFSISFEDIKEKLELVDVSPPSPRIRISYT